MNKNFYFLCKQNPKLPSIQSIYTLPTNDSIPIYNVFVPLLQVVLGLKFRYSFLMLTCITHRPIIFSFHHSLYQSHPLSQMYNFTLNQQFCMLRRWSQIRAVQCSCDVTGLPEARACDRRNCNGRRNIEDRSYGTSVETAGCIAQGTRDFEGECAAANVGIGIRN